LKIDIDMNSGNCLKTRICSENATHELKSSKCFKIGIYRNEPSVSFRTNIPLRNLFQLFASVISHCSQAFIVYFLEKILLRRQHLKNWKKPANKFGKEKGNQFNNEKEIIDFHIDLLTNFYWEICAAKLSE